MRLVLATLPAAVIVGYLARGRLSNLTSVSIRWPALAAMGLALQLVARPAPLAMALLYVSFVLLLVFAEINHRLPGFILILIGLALNFLVIGANHGMPVSEHALVASGQADTFVDLVTDGGAKHHLAGPDDVLVPLGDVIAVGPPIRQAISVGDIGTHLGVAWFVVWGMRGRKATAGGRLSVAEPNV